MIKSLYRELFLQQILQHRTAEVEEVRDCIDFDFRKIKAQRKENYRLLLEDLYYNISYLEEGRIVCPIKRKNFTRKYFDNSNRVKYWLNNSLAMLQKFGIDLKVTSPSGKEITGFQYRKLEDKTGLWLGNEEEEGWIRFYKFYGLVEGCYSYNDSDIRKMNTFLKSKEGYSFYISDGELIPKKYCKRKKITETSMVRLVDENDYPRGID